MVPITTQPQVTWVRSKTGMIAGVCDGIARRIGVETWMVRFFWLMSILIFGTGLFAYLVLAVCFPREDRTAEAYDRMILGVCSRVARRANIEVGLVRAAFVLLTCLTGGVVLLAYFVLYFVLPEPDQTTPKTF